MDFTKEQVTEAIEYLEAEKVKAFKSDGLWLHEYNENMVRDIVVDYQFGNIPDDNLSNHYMNIIFASHKSLVNNKGKIDYNV